MKRVLVLLAAHNGAAAITKQIETVLAQRGVDVVIDVGDDASTDATREVVAALARIDPRVRLLDDHSAKGSASANFFWLMRQADLTGVDYVAFCDQDDEWFDFKMSRAVETLQTQSAAGYSAAVTACWPDGREKTLAQDPAMRSADYLFEGAGQGCTFVLRADFFERAREALACQPHAASALHFHDWATFAIARTSGHAWAFDAEATMRYVQHGGNDTGARSSGQGVKRRLALIRRGWYRKQVDSIAALVAAVNPRDAQASAWLALSGASGSLVRLRKAVFVARRGRRRGIDRTILVAAALLGYL